MGFLAIANAVNVEGEVINIGSNYEITMLEVFDTIKNTIKNLSFVIQHNGFERKLNTSFNVSAAFGDDTDSFRSGLTAGYQLSSSDTFTLALWFTRFNGAEATRSSFSEIFSQNHRIS